jgi:hypothetical protein
MVATSIAALLALSLLGVSAQEAGEYTIVLARRAFATVFGSALKPDIELDRLELLLTKTATQLNQHQRIVAQAKVELQEAEAAQRQAVADRQKLKRDLDQLRGLLASRHADAENASAGRAADVFSSDGADDTLSRMGRRLGQLSSQRLRQRQSRGESGFDNAYGFDDNEDDNEDGSEDFSEDGSDHGNDRDDDLGDDHEEDDDAGKRGLTVARVIVRDGQPRLSVLSVNGRSIAVSRVREAMVNKLSSYEQSVARCEMLDRALEERRAAIHKLEQRLADWQSKRLQLAQRVETLKLRRRTQALHSRTDTSLFDDADLARATAIADSVERELRVVEMQQALQADPLADLVDELKVEDQAIDALKLN